MSIKIENIVNMVLESDQNGNPVMNVTEKLDDNSTRVSGFPLITGYGVHLSNVFLRSLNLDIEITFESFAQYGMLIMDVHEALEERNGGNA